MEVSIKIKNCDECPYLDHNGRIQKTTYWTCEKNEGKKLTVMDKTGSNNRLIKIPSWCPLKAKI